MPTIIDSLLVTLGLDASGFKQGEKDTREALKKTRDETDRHTKEMSERANVTAAAFGKIRTEILGMLGVALSGAGLAKFVEKITTGDAAVGRLATNLGVATRQLSSWEGMAGKFGGSAADMDAAFRTAFKISENFKQYGSDPSTGAFARLFAGAGMGDGLAKLTAFARSGDVEAMMKLIQQAVTLSKDKGNAMNLLGQAGFSEQTFNVMREVGAQLDRQLAIQRQLNTVGDRDKQLAIDRQQAWSRLGDAIESAGRKMLNASRLTSSIEAASSAVGEAAGGSPFSALWHFYRKTFIDPVYGTGAKASTGGASGSWGSPGAPAGVSKQQFLANLEKSWGLPPGLMSAQQSVEGWKGKDSPKGAQGPAQFMPKTGEQYGLHSRADRENFWKASEAQAHMMFDLLRKYGNLRQALMAYNGGGGGAAGRFPESVNYANRIMARMPGSGNSTEVNIGQVNIQTQATDAKGIARGFASGVHDSYAFAAQGGVGLQ